MFFSISNTVDSKYIASLFDRIMLLSTALIAHSTRKICYMKCLVSEATFVSFFFFFSSFPFLVEFIFSFSTLHGWRGYWGLCLWMAKNIMVIFLYLQVTYNKVYTRTTERRILEYKENPPNNFSLVFKVEGLSQHDHFKVKGYTSLYEFHWSVLYQGNYKHTHIQINITFIKLYWPKVSTINPMRIRTIAS